VVLGGPAVFCTNFNANNHKNQTNQENHSSDYFD
jgi:hypothetical protein